VLTGSKVAAVVYDFTQRCFIGDKNDEPLDFAVEAVVFGLLSNGPLTLREAHQLALKQRRLLKELLTQYIMFLEMNRGLPFPPSFLAGSSKDQLGETLLAYICEHRWPFPQMLPRRLNA
jgi:hypothetical protein